MVSLLQAIQLTGSVPPQMASRTDISELLSKSNRPLVVLAEGTTSNNVRVFAPLLLKFRIDVITASAASFRQFKGTKS